MRRWIQRGIVLGLMISLFGLIPVQAQQNLLQDPGFEGTYRGQMGRGDFNFPQAWQGWFTDAPRTEAWMNQPPNAFPHTSYFKYGGAKAQSISKGGGTFTAAAIQQVDNIQAGAVLRASAFVLIENGDGSNAQVRIGIGSNVGNNVYGAITWSPWETRRNEYHQISVDHTATGGSVTVFIYATQAWPNDPNAVYIDDASLVVVGEGQAPAGGDGGNDVSDAVPAPPAQPGVAFVVPQDEVDGTEEVTHTVGSGDTLASIAVAYGVSVDELLGLNGLERGSFLQIGQVLVIATPDPDAVASTDGDDEESSDVETDEPDGETTEEAEVTDEPTFGAVITEFTDTPEPTATPAESPTPSDTPTETPIPDTATPAPTAPVAQAAIDGVVPIELNPGICIAVFDDDNANGVAEPGEANLADGIVTLSDSDGTELETYITDGEPELLCFEELEAGRYTLNGIAPEGYGLTTSPILRVNLEDGETITVRYGAKLGLEVLAIPTVNPNPPTEPAPETGATSDEGDLSESSGLIVFGLAGAVLVLGMGASLLMRGR